jgi:hypothetical protein
MTDAAIQRYCNKCWVMYPYEYLTALGSQMYCKECYHTMATQETYQEKPDRGTVAGAYLHGQPDAEDQVQRIIAEDPSMTPKGEGVVQAGVPLGSDINAGRNDSGRGAVPPGSPSLTSPQGGQKAQAGQTLSPTGGGKETKSKATKLTTGGQNTP